MAFSRPELLIPSILALVCALYPAPWHLRNRNIATLGMIFWMTSLNLVHIVNCVVWSGDAEIKVPVWCDISVMINMLYNYGLPLSHLILSRQIEACTSLRMDSPLYSSVTRRRGKIIDLSLALAGPMVGFLVSLSTRASRFDVIEGYGSLPGVYWDTWGVVVPMSIAALCAVYTCKACHNIYKRRREMLSIISSNSSVSKNDFLRLLILAIAELGTCMLRATFNMTWGTRGLARLAADPDTLRDARSFTAVRTASLDQLSDVGRRTQDLSWFTVVVCSFIFFLCSANSHETKRFYWSLLERSIPAVRQYRRRKEQHQQSSFVSTLPTGSTTAVALDDVSAGKIDKELSFVELVTGKSDNDKGNASKDTLV